MERSGQRVGSSNRLFMALGSFRLVRDRLKVAVVLVWLSVGCYSLQQKNVLNLTGGAGSRCMRFDLGRDVADEDGYRFWFTGIVIDNLEFFAPFGGSALMVLSPATSLSIP